MSDERPDLSVAFEDGEEEYVRESEVPAADPPATEEEGLPPEIKKKTKKELAAELAAAKAQSEALAQRPDATAQAIGKLADSLQQQRAPVAPSAGAADDSAAFEASLKTDLFDDAKVGKTFAEGVRRYATPLLAAQNQIIFKQAVALKRLDPEDGAVFRKYEGEVLQYITKNFPGYEGNPQALDLAYDRVKAAHIDDIVKERADARVAQELQRLKAETATAPAAPRPPLTLEAGGTGGRPAPKRTVVVTAEDERLAELRGVDPTRVARARLRAGGGK